MPNALAGEVLQSGAFVVPLGTASLALARRAPAPAERAMLAILVLLLALSVALGHPWHGFGGSILLAAAIVPLALVPRVA